MKRATGSAQRLCATCFGLIIAAGGALLGCSAEVRPSESSANAAELPHLPEHLVTSLRYRRTGPDKPFTDKDRAQVLDILRTQGHDVKGATFFAEDAVLIEGDMLFDGPTVLQDASFERPKGRWTGPPDGLYGGYNVLGANKVRIVFNNSVDDWGWAFAFSEAVADFATNTNIQFTFNDEPDVVGTIVVYPYPYTNWGLALSPLGHDIYNPSLIGINTNYIGRSPDEPNCYWKDYHTIPYDIKRRTVRHELLHAIGFAHENDPAFPVIPGTVEGGPTIMWPGECWDGPYTLTWPDAHMVNSVYYFPPL